MKIFGVKSKFAPSGFLGSTGTYLLSNILNSVVPFILLPVLTRYLSPSEYGEVAMFQTLLGILAAFVGIVFVNAANRKYFDEHISKADLSQFIGSCIQLSVIFSLVIFILLFIFRENFSIWLSLKPQYMFLAILVAFSNVIFRMRLGQWQVTKQAVKFGCLQVSQSILDLLLSLLFVILLLKGVSGRINAQFFASFSFFIISIYLLYKDNLINVLSWRRAYLIEALQFGLPLMIHMGGAFLLLTFDRIFINKQLGLLEVGIYMVAVQLVGVMSLVFDAINKAYVPYLYECLKRNDRNEKIKIVKMIYLWFCTILCGVALAFIIGPWIVVLIAGESYSKAGDFIGLLALGQGFRGMYLMVTNFIFYSKKTIITASITITVGIFNVLLLFLLIKPYGINGAAIANAISMGGVFIITWYFAAKLVPMPWSLK